jgi:hypothetical protein
MHHRLRRTLVRSYRYAAKGKYTLLPINQFTNTTKLQKGFETFY